MSSNILKSVWAKRDGEWIHIKDAESGLKCNCVCPICGEAMVAKKGEITEHHFAHYTLSNCEYNGETALHLISKDIISNAKRIKIPMVTLWDIEDVDRIYSFGDGCLFKETYVSVDSVFCEKRINIKDRIYIVPDILIVSNNVKLIIEIKVTHAISNYKKELIKDLNISTIEIVLNKDCSYSDLEDMLINSIENKSWIYNKKANEIMDIIYKNPTLTSNNHKGNSVYWKCPIDNSYKNESSCYSNSCLYNFGFDMDYYNGEDRGESERFLCSYKLGIKLKNY